MDHQTEDDHRDPRAPLITVFILNWNGAGVIVDALRAAAMQDFLDYEIVVVDNASTDDSRRLIRKFFPEIRILQLQNNLGYTGAFNIAAGGVTSPYLAFLTNDCRPASNWLSETFRLLRNDPNTVVCGIELRRAPDGSKLENAGSQMDIFVFPRGVGTGMAPGSISDSPAFFVGGTGMVVNRRFFEEIGRFDPELFMYDDDLDLCWRARLRGHKIAANRNTWAMHIQDGQPEKTKRLPNNPRRRYLGERNTLRILLKNYSATVIVFILPLYFTMLFAETLFYAFSGATDLARSLVFAIAANIKNLPATLAARRVVQSTRVVSDREIMHMISFTSFKLQYLFRRNRLKGGARH
jgi:GT2 family glycosyltransferase